MDSSSENQITPEKSLAEVQAEKTPQELTPYSGEIVSPISTLSNTTLFAEYRTAFTRKCTSSLNSAEDTATIISTPSEVCTSSTKRQAATTTEDCSMKRIKTIENSLHSSSENIDLHITSALYYMNTGNAREAIQLMEKVRKLSKAQYKKSSHLLKDIETEECMKNQKINNLNKLVAEKDNRIQELENALRMHDEEKRFNCKNDSDDELNIQLRVT